VLLILNPGSVRDGTDGNQVDVQAPTDARDIPERIRPFGEEHGHGFSYSFQASAA
jgi:hypothetical protein